MTQEVRRQRLDRESVDVLMGVARPTKLAVQLQHCAERPHGADLGGSEFFPRVEFRHAVHPSRAQLHGEKSLALRPDHHAVFESRRPARYGERAIDPLLGYEPLHMGPSQDQAEKRGLVRMPRQPLMGRNRNLGESETDAVDAADDMA
jgi:hypothetical protein